MWSLRPQFCNSLAEASEGHCQRLYNSRRTHHILLGHIQGQRAILSHQQQSMLSDQNETPIVNLIANDGWICSHRCVLQQFTENTGEGDWSGSDDLEVKLEPKWKEQK